MMFPNLSDRAVAAIAFIVTVVCLTLLWIIGPLPSPDTAQNGGAVSSTR